MEILVITITVLAVISLAIGIYDRFKSEDRPSTLLVILESSEEGKKCDQRHQRMNQYSGKLTPSDIYEYAEEELNKIQSEGRNAIITDIKYFE